MVVNDKSRGNVLVKTQQVLQELNKWASLNSIIISKEKSTLLDLSPSKDKMRNPITLSDTIIPWVENVKLLGVSIEENLKWDKQMSNVIHKSNNLAKQISFVVRANKGGKVHLNRHLIKQLLIPKIDYGWQALWNVPKKIYTRIEILENDFIRRIYGINRLAPNDVIRQLSGIPRFSERTKWNKVKFLLKEKLEKQNIWSIKKLVRQNEKEATQIALTIASENLFDHNFLKKLCQDRGQPTLDRQ